MNTPKQIANNQEWQDKTTTLSGMGALIVTAIVTYFTAGAGAGIAGSLSGAAAAGTSATATQLATQAAIQAVIQSVATQASVQLAGSVITGNKLKLDLNSIAKSAVTAGVLSYADGLVKVANLGLGETTQKIAQTVTDTTLKTGVQSAVFKTDFKDSLVSNLAMAGSDLLAKETFYEVGNTSMEKSVADQNELYKDGGLVKTLLHSATGAGIAAINNEDILAGALSAGAREIISPLSGNYSKKGQLLVSQLTGILVGGIVDGEAGAKSGMNIATAGELYNRQLHQDEIKWLEDDKNAQKLQIYIKEQSGKDVTLDDAKTILAKGGASLVDSIFSNLYESQADNTALNVLYAQDFIKKNYDGKSLIFLDNGEASNAFNPTNEQYNNRYSNLSGYVDNKDFYNKNLALNPTDNSSSLEYAKGALNSVVNTGKAIYDSNGKIIVDGVSQLITSPIDTLIGQGVELRNTYEEANIDAFVGDYVSAKQKLGELGLNVGTTALEGAAVVKVIQKGTLVAEEIGKNIDNSLDFKINALDGTETQYPYKKLSADKTRDVYKDWVDSINTNLEPTKENAIKVSQERASFKQSARELMKDEAAAQSLPPVEDFNYYQNKYSAEPYNLKGEVLWKRIIEGATKTNKEYNAKYGSTKNE